MLDSRTFIFSSNSSGENASDLSTEQQVKVYKLYRDIQALSTKKNAAGILLFIMLKVSIFSPKLSLAHYCFYYRLININKI